MQSADPGKLIPLKDDCEKLGVSCALLYGDVRVDKDITAAVHAVRQAHGTIDILFNNAGICAYGRRRILLSRSGMICATLI